MSVPVHQTRNVQAVTLDISFNLLQPRVSTHVRMDIMETLLLTFVHFAIPLVLLALALLTLNVLLVAQDTSSNPLRRLALVLVRQ